MKAVSRLPALLLLMGGAAYGHPQGRDHSQQHAHEARGSLDVAATNDSSDPLIFYGRFISTPDPSTLSIQPNMAILVTTYNGRGVIAATAQNVSRPEDAAAALGVSTSTQIITPTTNNSFFFPGFIDTHIHAPQYPNLGLFAGTLLDWLQKYTFPMESSLSTLKSPQYANWTGSSPPNPYERARRVYNRVIDSTLSFGTTTCAYYATIDVPATNLLADLAYQKGQRALIGRTCMDNQEYNPDYYRDESTEAAINATWEVINHVQALDPSGDLVAPIITPRFAPACTNESMSELGKIAAEKNLPTQMHIDENVREVALVAQMYPQYDSYAATYDANGLLTNRTILAHAVHVTDAEIALIAARGSGVSHCPDSNSALGSGIAPVRKMRDAGIAVGLGTDAAGGFSPSLLDNVRQAFLVSQLLSFQEGQNSSLIIPVAEALYLGTMGGAKVVGMEGRLGGFQKGMLFDAQEITLGSDADEVGDVDIFGWENWSDRVMKWVWGGNADNVSRVWVGGRLVHQK
jgi:guanine deaminase